MKVELDIDDEDFALLERYVTVPYGLSVKALLERAIKVSIVRGAYLVSRINDGTLTDTEQEELRVTQEEASRLLGSEKVE